MEKPNEIEKPKIGAVAELSLLEKVIYFAIYLYFFAMAVYQVYIFPQENPKELYSPDFTDGWKILGRKKDNSDFEWQYWKRLMVPLMIGLSLHSVGNRLVSWLYPQYRMAYFAIFPFGCLTYSLGWKQTMIFLGHNVVYFIASKTKSIVICWLLCISLLISFVSFNQSIKLQFYTFNRNRWEGDFALITSLMCQLKGTSFCLDSCYAAKKEKSTNTIKYGFVDLIGYNFYLPLFCSGPVVNFDDFYIQVSKPPAPLSKKVLKSFAWDGVRSIFWHFVVEISSHYLYVSSLSKDLYIIENYSLFFSSGLVYLQVLFFSVKYVIFYRVAGMYSRLDGINPPDIPMCVLNIYLFTTMWKTFDKGLHNWLMKYIYIPLGGSKNGAFRQMLSSITTFGYVYYWHGAYVHFVYWSLIQWFGVFLEAMMGKLEKTKTFQYIEHNMSSPTTRRLHALAGMCSLISGILSNNIFLIGIHPILAYLKAVFLKGSSWNIFWFFAVAYCLVQVIMEVKIRTKLKPKFTKIT
ncbi:protein-cysteine N-palmitoyltransferase HHAT-like [Xenia sp. Carnegie-2017]|uniref:protein-cysteine N-palmitoyltransferase HHAT-like n=1 Tax=Xenia sp. Carnegie-2017 TaxID=2897299 RepID=UPI001F03F685|nr:protein-cysteine N-palmitoyltransferase HHAT-like [Xenia sp. Carnegie-2017]